MSVLMSVSRAVCWIIDECGDGEGRRKWGGFRGHYIFVEYSIKSILTH